MICPAGGAGGRTSPIASWGTVREDYSPTATPGTTCPTTWRAARPIAGARTGSPASATATSSCASRPPSGTAATRILKERLFGVDAARGQPRRGRQGVLLPRRQHADALVHVPPLQVSAGGVPVRASWSRRTSAAPARAPSTSCSTPAIFDDDRYFDIVIEYAKADPEDLAIRIEALNRGPDAAPLHILPHLWFRNTWAWGATPRPEPRITPASARGGVVSLVDRRRRLADRSATIPVALPARPAVRCTARRRRAAVHRQRDERRARLRPGQRQPHAVRQGRLPPLAVRRRSDARSGPTASAPRRRSTTASMRPGRRLGRRSGSGSPTQPTAAPLADGRRDHRRAQGRGRRVLRSARTRPSATADERLVQRQALAGLLWTQAELPLRRRRSGSTATTRRTRRRRVAADDPQPALAAPQLDARDDDARQVGVPLVRRLGPRVPVRAVRPGRRASSPRTSSGCCCSSSSSTPTARSRPTSGSSPTSTRRSTPGRSGASTTWTGSATGKADRDFLERCFHKLLINFAWWVNKVDREGNNIFEGGFLGLDNITVVDRSEPARRRRGARAVRRHRLDGDVLPEPDADRARAGARRTRSTRGWRQVLPALHLRRAAMKHMGNRDYSALGRARTASSTTCCATPTAASQKFRVRSLVGLIPLFAVERLEVEWIEPFKEFTREPQLVPQEPPRPGRATWSTRSSGPTARPTYLLTIVEPGAARAGMLGHAARRAPSSCRDYGIRSLSKAPRGAPVRVRRPPRRATSRPSRRASSRAATRTGAGRSGSRRPSCIIESLRKLGTAFGAALRAWRRPAPGGSRSRSTTMARDIAAPDDPHLPARRRPAAAPSSAARAKFQDDPHWRDHLLFYEYFHGDNGAGLGASPPDRLDRAGRHPDRRVALTSGDDHGPDPPPDPREAVPQRARRCSPSSPTSRRC